ncbi:GGDEF domain-containing protein [Pediococcus siamensis]|uniref:GGDEF domain-containing protein n=1 Tax=Pediococcus siamensis TaxID=381829 RepID=UPI0039A1ABC0
MTTFLYAALVMTFFNIGFVGILQLLMHLVDPNNVKFDERPWRTELIYVGYAVLLSIGLLGVSRQITNDFTANLLVGIQFLTLTSLISVLKTLELILTTIAANFFLFIIIVGGTNWQFANLITLLLFLIVFAGLLTLERHYFFPFDEHRQVRLFVDVVTNVVLWGYLAYTHNASYQTALTLLSASVIATVVTFYYKMLLRQDHKKKVQLEIEATYDDLTQTRNWRTFQMDLQHAYQLYNSSLKLCLVSFDIDHFKAINDNYGHEAGNVALATLSRELKNDLNAQQLQDCLYRTGGEEFCILLPNTSLTEANEIAQRCLQKVQNLGVKVDHQQKIALTISLGVSQLRDGDPGGEALFERVDQDLYHSKQTGRNRITTDS